MVDSYNFNPVYQDWQSVPLPTELPILNLQESPSLWPLMPFMFLNDEILHTRHGADSVHSNLFSQTSSLSTKSDTAKNSNHEDPYDGYQGDTESDICGNMIFFLHCTV